MAFEAPSICLFYLSRTRHVAFDLGVAGIKHVAAAADMGVERLRYIAAQGARARNIHVTDRNREILAPHVAAAAHMRFHFVARAADFNGTAAGNIDFGLADIDLRHDEVARPGNVEVESFVFQW